MVANILGRYRQQQDPLRSERRMELLFIALLLVVLLQLIWLGMATLRSSSIEPVSPAPDSLRVVTAADPGSINASQSLLLQSRPLFWASRRPLASVQVADSLLNDGQSAPARRLDNLQVTGVLGSGSQGSVIVTYKGERARLSVGDALDGWSLQSVRPGEAVFVSAGARDVRRLLPLPVAATQTDAARERGARPADAPPDGSPRTADVDPQAAAAAPAAQENGNQKRSLSLGG